VSPVEPRRVEQPVPQRPPCRCRVSGDLESRLIAIVRAIVEK